MKHRTMLAFAPIAVACALLMSACSDSPFSPPSDNGATTLPTIGSSFVFRVWATDSVGNISPESTLPMTKMLLRTDATVAGRSNVRTILQSYGPILSIEPDTLYLADEPNGDVSLLYAVYHGTTTDNNGWIPLPVASKQTQVRVVLDTIGEWGIHTWMVDTIRYIGAENLKIGSRSVATEHLRVTSTLGFGNSSNTSNSRWDIWYAPSLKQIVKRYQGSEVGKESYNEQMTEITPK